MDPASILAELDALARRSEFPVFDHDDYATIDARMHLHRGASGWAILIEEAVDWLGPEGPRVIVFGAGPGLVGSSGGLFALASRHLEVVMDEDFEVTSARLRGESLALAPIRDLARDEDIETPRALLVDLSRRRRDELFFTTRELAPLVRPDLSRVLRVEAWRHPDVRAGELPSTCEAFELAALVLATGAIAAWAPSERANNADWKHWRQES